MITGYEGPFDRKPERPHVKPLKFFSLKLDGDNADTTREALLHAIGAWKEPYPSLSARARKIEQTIRKGEVTSLNDDDIWVVREGLNDAAKAEKITEAKRDAVTKLIAAATSQPVLTFRQSVLRPAPIGRASTVLENLRF